MVYKYDQSQGLSHVLKDRLRLRVFRFQLELFTIAVAIATHTVFPLLRAIQQRKINRGETIWLDDMPGPPQTQSFEHLEYSPADLSPNPGLRRKRARSMKVDSPPADYPFAYRNPPISGNLINGLGEAARRRPDHVFFGDSYARAWGKLDWYFQVMEPTSIHRQIVRIFWQDRKRVGLVCNAEQRMRSANDDAAAIRSFALQQGAALVGITSLQPEFCYHDSEPNFQFAISVAVLMDRAEMVFTPSDRSNREIMDAYHRVNRVAVRVAELIRSWGYPAQASTNLTPGASSEVLHVPIAISAGVGQLGKHGSIITAEYGSNIRLATVLTDLPLTSDKPRDIGVDDFCTNCKVCETNCPPHAIYSEKQLVRGDRRWYVDFDKCIPYFAETRGCGICIEVCPWSEPGKGQALMQDLLAKRREANGSKQNAESGNAESIEI